AVPTYAYFQDQPMPLTRSTVPLQPVLKLSLFLKNLIVDLRHRPSSPDFDVYWPQSKNDLPKNSGERFQELKNNVFALSHSHFYAEQIDLKHARSRPTEN